VIGRSSIGALLREKRILVCCGAGGVGKTTTAAALSLAAARAGRRVLVLTIDPSRRLAETLGVSRNPPEPIPVPAERLAQAGIRPPGSLHAWMLDHKRVADEAVRRLTKNPAEAEKVLGNRIYQQVSNMVAGMHEYTAMESLHRLVGSNLYDLVVLDTPPSRHALDFLEAPGRLSRLIDSRAVQAFLPKGDGLVARAASKLIQMVFARIFGEEFAAEFVGFLGTFSVIFQSLTADVSQMRAFLGSGDAAFVLVASPQPSMLTEAHFFQQKTRELRLPLRAFVLNRSRARNVERRMPDLSLFGPEPTPAERSALVKLQAQARHELELAGRDVALLRDLEVRAGEHACAVALPELSAGADEMATLVTIAEVLAAS
jgi:anion-transporting  ArsA/GET3 family ATPase